MAIPYYVGNNLGAYCVSLLCVPSKDCQFPTITIANDLNNGPTDGLEIKSHFIRRSYKQHQELQMWKSHK